MRMDLGDQLFIRYLIVQTMEFHRQGVEYLLLHLIEVILVKIILISQFPEPIKLQVNLRSILDENVDKKYFLSEKILPTILSHGTGNYYSKSEIDLQIARPLCATMHKMHRASQDNYVTDIENRSKFEDTDEKRISNVRRLTPNECRKLQGFPSDWEINVSDTQAYRQFGNAVTVDVAYNVAMQIVRTLNIELEIEG